MRRKPTNWKDTETITAKGQLGNTWWRDVQFQKNPKKLPEGIPSISTSSPLIEEDKGPKGELEEGRTTVVSQYVGTASRRAIWYDCERSARLYGDFHPVDTLEAHPSARSPVHNLGDPPAPPAMHHYQALPKDWQRRPSAPLRSPSNQAPIVRGVTERWEGCRRGDVGQV